MHYLTSMNSDTSSEPSEPSDAHSQESVAAASVKPRCRVLHLLIETPETVMAYKEFVVAQADRHKISVCTYFKSISKMPEGVTLFEGDRTLFGFWRALKVALRSDDFDAIHAHFPNVAVPLILVSFWKFSLMRKTVFTVHTSYPNLKLRNRLLLLLVFACFRTIICCSRSSYESFPWLYRRLAGKRLSYIRNGVDTKRIDRIRRQGVPRNGETFTVITACRFVSIKNLQTALLAFKKCGDTGSRFIVVGDGPLSDQLKQLSRQEGFDEQVEFTGLIDRDEVYKKMLNADLFISTSLGEGLPIAVMEAMACGCPVLLSDIEPHREIADDAGFIPLVKPDDLHGFAKEIKRFRSKSKAERAEIGDKCRQLMENQFSLDVMHAAYERVYLSGTH